MINANSFIIFTMLNHYLSFTSLLFSVLNSDKKLYDRIASE